MIDPNTHEVRYIGKTIKNPEERLKGHLKSKTKTYTNNWIESLNTVKPMIQVVQTIYGDYWAEAEVYWIKYFKSIGCRLTNLTSGGEGVPGLKHSVTTKAKMSQSWKPKVISEEGMNNIIKSCKEREYSESFKSKVSKIHKGKVITQDVRDMISSKLRLKYILVDPNGKTYYTDNLKQFARDHSLTYEGLSQVSTGRHRTHKKWVCKKDVL